MWTEKVNLASAAVMVLALAACGTTNTMGTASSSEPIPVTTTTTASTTSRISGYGVVQAINVVPGQQGGTGVGLGTAAGAVVGGVLGNQVGSGRGRTAATGAGAAGGALGGSQMPRNSNAARATSDTYQVTVRMDNGAVQTLAMNSPGGLQVGERVRVENGVIVERFR